MFESKLAKPCDEKEFMRLRECFLAAAGIEPMTQLDFEDLLRSNTIYLCMLKPEENEKTEAIEKIDETEETIGYAIVGGYDDKYCMISEMYVMPESDYQNGYNVMVDQIASDAKERGDEFIEIIQCFTMGKKVLKKCKFRQECNSCLWRRAI